MRKEKKIAALTLTLGLTGLVSQALAKTSYYSSSDTDTLLGLSVATILVSALVSVGIAVVFGLITKHMNESKGYPGGFAWGFFLGIIGIIVVACKTDLRNTYPQNQNNYNSGYNASNTPDRSLQRRRTMWLTGSGSWPISMRRGLSPMRNTKPKRRTCSPRCNPCLSPK